MSDTRREAFEETISSIYVNNYGLSAKLDRDGDGYANRCVDIAHSAYLAAIVSQSEREELPQAEIRNAALEDADNIVFSVSNELNDCGAAYVAQRISEKIQSLKTEQPSAQSPGIDAVKVRGNALEAAFLALGRAGGNMLDSPYRKEWEACRSILHPVCTDQYKCTPHNGGEAFIIDRAPDSWELRECDIEVIKSQPLPSQPEPLGQALSDEVGTEIFDLIQQYGSERAQLQAWSTANVVRNSSSINPHDTLAKIRALLHKAGANDGLHPQLGIAAINGAPSHCFWKTGCSNSKRCSSNGSCVAAAQRADLSQPSDDGRGKP